MSGIREDTQLSTLIAQARSTAARLEVHVAACGACQGRSAPPGASCPRRTQLERLLAGQRALIAARQKALRRL